MDEQLSQIAEQTGVPADLLERAARARAAAQGVAVEALVTGWAGGEAPASAPAPAPAEPAAPAAAEPPAPAPAPAAEAPAPAAPAASGGKQLPEALLRRSAEARAKREGRSVEDVLAEMTGGGEASDAPPAPPAEEPGAGKLPDALLRRSAKARAKREGRPLDEVLVEMGLSPEGAKGEAPAAAPAGASAPSAPGSIVDAGTPDVTTPVATEAAPEEDEKEAAFAGFPRWLAASFIIIPLFALLYAGFAPNGPSCGASGQLSINPVTGEAEACGGAGSAFFKIGQGIFNGQCAACHSTDGSGGVGPALAGGSVLQTFSACSDQIEWVTLGSNNWPNATYGDTNKPVLGRGVAMPGYDGSLSAEEIASVVLYERVAFGGADPITEEAACGLGAAAGG